MVKRSRDQSAENPSRRIWRRMRSPVVTYQACTRASKASRPIRSLEVFSLASWRSITAWVAIAAWSVPGTQSVVSPSIRCQRVSTSWSVYMAWPMCKSPVILGGGMETVKVRPERAGEPDPVRGQYLLLQPADGQHPSPERDLPGQRHVGADRPLGERRNYGQGDRDPGRRAVLGDGPFGDVDVQVQLLPKVDR